MTNFTPHDKVAMIAKRDGRFVYKDKTYDNYCDLISDILQNGMIGIPSKDYSRVYNSISKQWNDRFFTNGTPRP